MPEWTPCQHTRNRQHFAPISQRNGNFYILQEANTSAVGRGVRLRAGGMEDVETFQGAGINTLRTHRAA